MGKPTVRVHPYPDPPISGVPPDLVDRTGVTARAGVSHPGQGTTRRSVASADRVHRPRTGVGQWNESPQAQEPDAFGLSIVKPCASMRSAKSMVAPVR